MDEEARGQRRGDVMLVVTAIGVSAIALFARLPLLVPQRVRNMTSSAATGGPLRKRKSSMRPTTRRAVVSILGIVASVLSQDPMLMVVVLGAVASLYFVAPKLAKRRADLARVVALERAAPVLIDLIRSGTSAGIPLREILLAVPRGKILGELMVLDVALERLCSDTHAGGRLVESINALRKLSTWYEHLADAIVASERYGTSLGPTLDMLSLEARANRRRRLETAARRLPVTMLFPLVTCVLPAFALLTVVPLFVSGFSTLRW